MCARNVILGLPVEAIRRINFPDREVMVTLDELLPSVEQVCTDILFFQDKSTINGNVLQTLKEWHLRG